MCIYVHVFYIGLYTHGPMDMFEMCPIKFDVNTFQCSRGVMSYLQNRGIYKFTVPAVVWKKPTCSVFGSQLELVTFIALNV